MGSRFAVVAHAFGDYGEWYTFGFGRGGPAVACDVEGQRDCDVYLFGYSFQVVVDVVAGVAVGTARVDSGIADDGQQIVAGVLGVFVEYFLHLFRPFDDQLLAGLAAAVCDVAVLEVTLSQKRHIYEAHSPEIKAHKEHIAGVVERRSQRQIQCLNFLDYRHRQRAFDCLVNARIDVAERIAVLDDIVLNRPVIDGTEYSGVEGYCIESNPTALVPCLVCLHYPGGNAVEHYVLAASELLEAVERGLVGFGRSGLSVLFQFGDDTLHEVEQGVFMCVAVELVDYIVCGVNQTVGIQFSVNLR